MAIAYGLVEYDVEGVVKCPCPILDERWVFGLVEDARRLAVNAPKDVVGSPLNAVDVPLPDVDVLRGFGFQSVAGCFCVYCEWMLWAACFRLLKTSTMSISP